MTKIDIISGFLGAGKTTLIKRLLADALKGEQVVLIENEFGEIGIDGGFLKDAGIVVNEMNAGCICCSLVGDFGKALHDVVDQYHPDRILIEPSGVGKLSDVIAAVQNAHLEVQLNSFVTVVDALKAKMYLKNFGEFFENQVAHAGAILLSRTAECPEKRLDETVAMLRGLNEHARIVTTPWKDLTGEQYRLYRLVWSRFLASQMANAVYDSVAVEVEAAGHSFRASSSSLKFSGYTAVYEEGKDEEKEEKESPLPALREGEPLTLKDFDREQHFTQPPAHYTDATLIRAMEEQGIGRPSTYAPTVSTILDREYVVKEGKYLRITNLGRVVTALMKERFSDIADLKFTANMEQRLDSVEEGKTAWKDVLREFYGDFEQDLENAEKALDGARIKVPDEVSEEICPECGRNLVVKSGRFGRFLACPGYPECTFTMPLVVEMPGRCPKCGGRLMKRTGNSKKTGKQYTYYCCEHVNSKDETAKCDFMTWDVPVKDDCPVCGHTMFKKAGRGFKKPFCINPECSNFLPEEKRGYPRKKAADSAEGEEPAAAAEETAEKKPARRTAAAKKADTAKTAAKKSAAKKPAAAKTAAKKPAAKKETASKAAAKTTSTRKTAAKKTVASKAKKPAGKE